MPIEQDTLLNVWDINSVVDKICNKCAWVYVNIGEPSPKSIVYFEPI